MKMSNSKAVNIGALICSVSMAAPAIAEGSPSRTPLAELKNGFSNEQVQHYRENYTLKAILGGDDPSVWLSTNTSEMLPTAVVPRRAETMPLETHLKPEIGKINAETKRFGEMSLDEYLASPDNYAAGFIVVHQGNVVYESYPGMNSSDSHLWMSVAKPLTSLAIDILTDQGRIDSQKTVGHYLPEFQNTDWQDIKIIDILDMTPGMNSEENDATRADPDSIVIRSFNAEFGIPYKGKMETLTEVLQDAKSVSKPGTKFEYGSPTTQMLVLLVEGVTGVPFAQFIDKNVWSKVGAEGALNFHLSPDGVALVHGVVSSRLRDLARFGMLYTPSWDKIATSQVVTPEMIERIRSGVRGKNFYMNGYDGPVFSSRLNDDNMLGNSHQWDAVWADGDFWKSGVQSQGLYVSPDKDLVIAFYSTNVPDDSIHRFLRPIATAEMFKQPQ